MLRRKRIKAFADLCLYGFLFLFLPKNIAKDYPVFLQNEYHCVNIE